MQPTGQQSDQRQVEAKRWAASCDSNTLVTTAKKGLYGSQVEQNDLHVKASIEEIVSRFESGGRALAPQEFAGLTSGSPSSG